MINSLNSTKIENQIINTVPGSIKTWAVAGTWSTWVNLEANIFIDTNLIQNGNFEVGYIEIFWTRYKVVRSSTEKYFTNNYVRYGDVFSLDSNQKIGTINFVVSALYIIEWTIRLPNDENYGITQVPETSAYYHIKKIQ
jgi:hypothetical protein